ncbi:MAG: ATP-binding cassette domain-containing protein [Candidatus Aureabacteria bacterium]|nr:ATP-binding cassette domain-containing protein [Candidatus Auribacterota bacterium]
MIDVQHLTKRYGDTLAVDDISFRVNKGETLGFLGPNGAGKTTTMRILTCFMPPSSGSATVADYDIFSHSLDVRREIGYMPENVPLYPDMRVQEFLEYRARLKGVPRKSLKKRVQDVMEKTMVADVRHRIIGQLSKGYRQRVGLSEALVHDPKVLILDEPTIGLDPNQVRQVRKLIKELGGEHTVLISTHILPEVEMTCGRVIIIDHGRIAAMDTPERLMQHIKGGTTKLTLEVRGPLPQVRAAIEKISGVAKVEGRGDGVCTLTVVVEKGRDTREDIFRTVVENRWILREMKTEEVSLEDIFVHITMHEKDA